MINLPTEPPRFVAETRQAEDMLAVAIAHRPELAQQDLDFRAQALSVRKADNDKLPQIDAGVTAQLTGQDAGYRGALDELGRVDAPGYSVLLNMTWTASAVPRAGDPEPRGRAAQVPQRHVLELCGRAAPRGARLCRAHRGARPQEGDRGAAPATGRLLDERHVEIEVKPRP
jgi:hypothetical protein